MSVTKYEENGKTLFQVYVNLRSTPFPRIRFQRRVMGIEDESAAIALDKKLSRQALETVAQRERDGFSWEEILEKWELAMRTDPFNELHPMTIQDRLAALRKWTGCWLKRPANQLNRGDAKHVIRELALEGKSKSFQSTIKSGVNHVYTWAIEERLLPGIHLSPMSGIKLDKNSEDKRPEILNLDEIKKLIQLSKEQEHPWYPVYVVALLTGMRSGELQALKWSHVELETKRITVCESWAPRIKREKETKAGYWRTVPISPELCGFLEGLKIKTGASGYVLPRFAEWKQGNQAKVLKVFCLGNGLPAIKFHTLRACFATQLLAQKIAPATVMKICGWKDLNTMQRYIRLAGIDEAGATDGLRILTQEQALAEVVNLVDFKASRE